MMLSRKLPRGVSWLASVSLILALASLININVIIPSYIAYLGGTVFTVGIVYSLMAFFRALSSILSGYIRDKMGERIVFLLSLGATTLSFIVLFAANNLVVLALGLVTYALARGIETPTLLSATATIASETSLTATLFGVILTVRMMPTVISPAFTGYIADNLGVRIVFITGAILSSIGLLAMSRIRVGEKVGGERVERRTIFSREFLILIAATFFLFISVSAFVPILSYWVIQELKYSYITLGVILTARNIVAMFSRIYSGTLADKLGDLNLLISVGVIRATALLLLIFVKDPLAIALLVVLHGSLMAAPPRSAYISKIFAKENYGIAFGTISIVQNFGWMAGPILAGYIAEHYGYGLTYIMLAIALLIFASLVSLLKYYEGKH